MVLSKISYIVVMEHSDLQNSMVSLKLLAVGNSGFYKRVKHSEHDFFIRKTFSRWSNQAGQIYPHSWSICLLSIINETTENYV